MKKFELSEELKNKFCAYVQELPTKYGVELLKFIHALPEITEEKSKKEDKK